MSTLFTENSSAQHFSAQEYAKAVWMTGRFYGGQRSGENNWLLYDHLPEGVAEQYRGTAFIDDADGGHDLSGGWHDAGDHVKFGQTHFYAAYMLLKSYAEFPEGYDDLYSYDYQGYKAGGDWTWEGAKGSPNGIPDIVDEVKHATDYFIKCTPNSSTFYYRVGNGDADHAKWVTATKMQTLPVNEGGSPREVLKNPNDASMASFCGATLALMARLYEKWDPTYAQTCLDHAEMAYDYAKAHPGTGGSSGYYPANNNWKDDYATMCAELYWASGDNSYRSEALSFSTSGSSGQGADIYFNYSFDYNNNGEVALYNLAKLGHSTAGGHLNDVVNNHYFNNTNGSGLYDGGNAWGPLRYNANSSLIVALWQKLNGTDDTPHQFIYDNIDYILGDNSLNYSFVVGFTPSGGSHAIHPHHRNFYLNDENPGSSAKQSLVPPTKNLQFGLMVGGSRNPGSYSDDINSYTSSEGGIDYNACLVGALAFIRAALDPVDTNKFGNTTPDLGADQSICGLSSITLDANVSVDGVKTFTWFRNDQQQGSASTSANTFNVNSAGTYKVVLDSLGEWSTQDEVVISGDIGTVDLGDDVNLCFPAYVTLDAVITGDALSYSWERNGSTIDGETGTTLFVNQPGLYTVEVSALGCASVGDEVTITSNLPMITEGYVCGSTAATLSVSGDHSNYDWYGSESGNDLLESGTDTFLATEVGTYWAEDPSNQSYTTGPAFGDAAITGPEANNASSASSYLEIEVLSPFTLDELTFEVVSWSVEIGTITITEIGSGSSEEISFDIPNGGGDWSTINAAIDYTFGVGAYSIESSHVRAYTDAGGDFYGTTFQGLFTMSANHSNYNIHYQPNHYGGYFDWKVTSGTGCGRIPIRAMAGEGEECVITSSIEDESAAKFEIYPNPSQGQLVLNASASGRFTVINSLGAIVHSGQVSAGRNELSLDLAPGLYTGVVTSADQSERVMIVIR